MSSSARSTTKSQAKSTASQQGNDSSNSNSIVSTITPESNTEYIDDYRQIMLAYETTKRTTDPLMTVFEKSLILGKRATQIAMGAEPLIDVPARMTNVIEIAEEELRQKKTPFIIRRDLGNNKYEYWRIRDMIISLD